MYDSHGSNLHSGFLLTNINPASIQAFHGDAEALSFLTKPVSHWNGTVLKYDRSGWLRVPAYLKGRWDNSTHCDLILPSSGSKRTFAQKSVNGLNLLFFFAKGQARRSLLHHQTRDAFGSFTSCPAHHNIHVCVSSSTDEGLKCHQKQRRVSDHQCVSKATIHVNALINVGTRVKMLEPLSHLRCSGPLSAVQRSEARQRRCRCLKLNIRQWPSLIFSGLITYYYLKYW